MDITSLQSRLIEPDAVASGPPPRWVHDPILVLHPSRVTSCPRRGTQRRDIFLATTTPVRIPHVDPSAFEPVAAVAADRKVPMAVYAHEGVAWALMARNGGEAIHPDELRDFLGDRLCDGEALSWLGFGGFNGTPVAAAFVPGRPPVNSGTGPWRGSPEGSVSELAWDGRAEARAVLQDWIARNVVVAGNSVLMRWDPVLYWHPQHNGGNGHGYLSLAPLDSGLGVVGILPGTIDCTRELAGSFKLTAPHDPGLGWRAASAIGDLDGRNADVAIAVNLQAHRLRHALEKRRDGIRGKIPGSPDGPLVEKAVAVLKDIEWRSALGLAARDDHRADIDAFRSAVALEARLGGPNAGARSGNAFLHSWLELVAGPRMDRIQADDADAISRLAF